jgi:hypothetical protein
MGIKSQKGSRSLEFGMWFNVSLSGATRIQQSPRWRVKK